MFVNCCLFFLCKVRSGRGLLLASFIGYVSGLFSILALVCAQCGHNGAVGPAIWNTTNNNTKIGLGCGEGTEEFLCGTNLSWRVRESITGNRVGLGGHTVL